MQSDFQIRLWNSAGDSSELGQQVMEQLEILDDTIFKAIDGDVTALEQSAGIWESTLKNLGAELLKESRQQYLRQAEAQWQRLRCPVGREQRLSGAPIRAHVQQRRSQRLRAITASASSVKIHGRRRGALTSLSPPCPAGASTSSTSPGLRARRTRERTPSPELPGAAAAAGGRGGRAAGARRLAGADQAAAVRHRHQGGRL